ncbi:hypothetical protein D9619_001581 [Psilocybe cf. subviscida]|uniref:Uncharacterized protein n=1 Tax=Psilocybe cf. subviscida TaxID=2480587 RepID=A0A8H5F3N5_9AGAR|nr:hypothetical protein D9619_001581 [Psilocybe cf. subviscida]
MPSPGSDQSHHNAVFGDHVLVTGGIFTINSNVYSSPQVNSQQQVLDILCPRTGPLKIDGRLLHNSIEYEDVQLRGFQHIPNKVLLHSRQILQEVMDHLPKHGARGGSSYYIRRGSSKLVSIPVAERLASEGNLLATIILPDSAPPCTKFIVATLAYQLVRNIPTSAEYVLAALQQDPGIFECNTETQFKELFKVPLEKVYMNPSIAAKRDWPDTIVLDGNAQALAPGSAPHWILQSFSSPLSHQDAALMDYVPARICAAWLRTQLDGELLIRHASPIMANLYPLHYFLRLHSKWNMEIFAPAVTAASPDLFEAYAYTREAVKDLHDSIDSLSNHLEDDRLTSISTTTALDTRVQVIATHLPNGPRLKFAEMMAFLVRLTRQSLLRPLDPASSLEAEASGLGAGRALLLPSGCPYSHR